MAIDPNISLQLKERDLLAAATTAQELEQKRQLNPIEVQQKQANVQSTLNQNEQTRLANEQAQRNNNYANWLNQNPPVYKPDGSIDQTATLKAHVDAGFGAYANDYIAKSLSNDLSSITNKTQAIDAVRKHAISLSQAYADAPDATKKAEMEAADNLLRNSPLHMSVTDIMGADWITKAKWSGISPIDRDANTRANKATAMTEEAKDLNSDLNIAFRDFVKSFAPQLARKDPTLYMASILPGFEDVFASFRIPASMRQEGAKASVNAQLTVAKIDQLIGAINAIDPKNIKPAESIKVFLQRLAGTPDVTRLEAIIDELDKMGVKLDMTKNTAGVIDQLTRLKQNTTNQAASSARIVTAPSIGDVAESPAAVTDFSAGGGKMPEPALVGKPIPDQSEPAAPAKNSAKGTTKPVQTPAKAVKPQVYKYINPANPKAKPAILTAEELASPEAQAMIKKYNLKRVQ